ncbi:MAG: hypothetical protein NTY17_15955 [Planctomycetia bacterium]|nr:hypothetical protein [Planctomycetia bacterium]
MSVDTRNLVLCVLVTLGTMLVAWPFAEGGYIDDFSYIHMAKTLAETGRFAYNGWPTAMLGIQVWWGAAWIWLFGFSFTLVRLSVWPLALGAVALVYLLARRSSLSPSDSLFATLLTGLSTQFIDLAPTFMTDLPALSLLLASWYGFTRAIEEADQRPADELAVLRWLVTALACGIVGGTIRQSVWFSLLSGSAILFLRPGMTPRVRGLAFFAGGIGLACIIVGMRWFNSQPYAIPSQVLPLRLENAGRWFDGIRAFVGVVVPVVLLPMTSAAVWCLPTLWPKGTWRPTHWALIAAVLIATAAILLPAHRHAFDGVIQLFGQRGPVSVSAAIYEAAIAGFRITRLALLLFVLGVMAWDGQRCRREIVAVIRRLPPAILVMSAYLVLYLPAVIQASATTGGLWERYLLPVFPAVCCALLLWVEQRRSHLERRSVWGLCLLAVMAVYSVAFTHDRFADCRARVAAIAYLQGQGVPRNQIMTGWHIDGWAQIEAVGYLNDPRIRTPADAYVPPAPPHYRHTSNLLRALTPKFLVTDGSAECLGTREGFRDFLFTAWIPPHERRVFVCHQTAIEAESVPDR